MEMNLHEDNLFSGHIPFNLDTLDAYTSRSNVNARIQNIRKSISESSISWHKKLWLRICLFLRSVHSRNVPT